jgi:hypothetical protein
VDLSGNILPRIINILLSNPDALMRSQLLSDRMALDSRETKARNPLFTEFITKNADFMANSVWSTIMIQGVYVPVCIVDRVFVIFKVNFAL